MSDESPEMKDELDKRLLMKSIDETETDVIDNTDDAKKASTWSIRFTIDLLYLPFLVFSKCVHSDDIYNHNLAFP